MSRREKIREAVKATKAKAKASQAPLVDELQRSLGNTRVIRAMRGKKETPAGEPPKPPRSKPRLAYSKPEPK